MGRAVLSVSLFMLTIYIVSRQFSPSSLPTGTAMLAAFTVGVCVVVVITLLSMSLIRSAEMAFTRYVSQNVGYTSTMILKRVVKAKVEIGLTFLMLMYIPALNIFVQSFIVVTDWNDSLSSPFRKKVNFNVPCYLMAFPPYSDQKTKVTGFECPLKFSVASTEADRSDGFYDDSNIVQCDSYFGTLFFVFGIVFSVSLVVSYGYLLWRLIRMVINEYRNSRWVKPLYAVQDIYRSERHEYEHSFPLMDRAMLAVRAEALRQYTYGMEAAAFIISALGGCVGCLLRSALCPLSCVCAPVVFFGKRVFILACNDLTKEVCFFFNNVNILSFWL